MVGEQVERDLRIVRVPENFEAEEELSMQKHEEELQQFRYNLRYHTQRNRRSLVPGTKENLACIDQQHVTFDPLYEKMSEFEFKWNSGYTSTLFKRVKMNLRSFMKRGVNSQLWKTPRETFTDMCLRHASDVGKALVRFPSAFSTFATGSMANIAMFSDEGTGILRRIWDTHAALRKRASEIPVSEYVTNLRTETQDILVQTPVYRWYLGESASPFPTTIVSPQMSEHLSRLYRERKEYAAEHPEDTSSIFNGYGIPQHFKRIFEHLYRRYVSRFNIETDALHRVKRVYYQVYDTLYPGQLTEEQHKRFILDDNCPIVKRSVDLAVNVVQRCAAKASNQTQNFANDSLRDQVMRNVMHFQMLQSHSLVPS
jgi:hypothetical protein